MIDTATAMRNLEMLPTSLSVDIILLVLAAVAARVFYNLYLHPLSSFRGPKSLAAFGSILAYHQFKGTSHHIIKKAHDKYGTIVRIGPSELSFIAPSAWNDIYGHRSGHPALPKDRLFFNEMLVDKHTITLANDERHGRLRRTLNPAFSQKSVLEQEPILRRLLDLFIQRLGHKSGNEDDNEIEISKWYHLASFDILGDLAFGEDFGGLRTSTFHEWVQFVLDYFYAATALHVCHKFWLSTILTLLLPSSVIQKKDRHTAMALSKAHRRIESPTDRPDFMSHFLNNYEKEGLNLQDVEAQASILILAGAETTSAALSAATYYVLTNTNVYNTLRAEIRAAFSDEESIGLVAVCNLPYLSAVVQEALRIHPPVANGFLREVPRGGAMISETWVPGSTVVHVNHWSAYHSPINFIDPDNFHPERWLKDPHYETDHRDVCQPFSVGARNCIGKRFATDNIRLILARLLWRFDLELGEGCEGWNVGQKAFTSWNTPPLRVKIREVR